MHSAECLVSFTGAESLVARLYAEALVQETVYENSEYSDSKSRLVHVVSAVHFCCTGEQGRDEKSCEDAEYYREDDSKNAESGDFQRISPGIEE